MAIDALGQLLAKGHHYSFNDTPDPDTAEGLQRLREIWEQVREQFMDRWVQKHPATRPWAWWKLDAPELRRRSDGEPHPFDDPGYCAEDKRVKAEYPQGIDMLATSYGLPRYSDTDHVDGVYETEYDYLERLGLLAGSERQTTESTHRRS